MFDLSKARLIIHNTHLTFRWAIDSHSSSLHITHRSFKVKSTVLPFVPHNDKGHLHQWSPFTCMNTLPGLNALAVSLQVSTLTQTLERLISLVFDWKLCHSAALGSVPRGLVRYLGNIAEPEWVNPSFQCPAGPRGTVRSGRGETRKEGEREGGWGTDNKNKWMCRTGRRL